MTSYDYPKLIRQSCQTLTEIEGRTLVDFLVQIVDPEYNAATLIFADCAYAISGRIGSEILGIERVEIPRTGVIGREVRNERFQPYDEFLGRRIVQARMIGKAWNGHGFEFTFEGLPNRSMIVQSIYSSPKPPEAEDCIRLGIGHYSCGIEDTI